MYNAIKEKDRKDLRKMSKKSYWKLRPAAEEVYLNRQSEEATRELRTLSRGMHIAAAMILVCGFCLGNVELLVTGTVLSLIGAAL